MFVYTRGEGLKLGIPLQGMFHSKHRWNGVSENKTESFSLFIQVGGFVLPLLVFGGISLFLTLLLLINVHPTGVSVRFPS